MYAIGEKQYAVYNARNDIPITIGTRIQVCKKIHISESSFRNILHQSKIGEKKRSKYFIAEIDESLDDNDEYQEKVKRLKENMKNKMSDLNNILFQQLERIRDDSLTGEDFKQEIQRSKAISELSQNILTIADASIRAMQFQAKFGLKSDEMPELLNFDNE